MTRCPSCGHEATTASHYCSECGTAIPSVGAPGGDWRGEPTLPNRGSSGRSGAADPGTGGRRATASVTSDSRHTHTPVAGGGAFPAGAVLGGRFRIVGLLGRGGMGEVYRADDLTLGQSVALKFLPPAVADDPERRQGFLREVRIAREVSHPNVCRVYDIGDVDGLHYLSMEYIDGEDLASLLRRIGRLPGDKATEIARQLCAGLGAAHERGVLHRDLKPANVMIDGRGRVRITDFGLAGLAADLQRGSAPAGTPAYMAPEQLEGGELSERTDLYALGLVLYEIYTGKPVFRGGSLAEIHRLHRETTPTRPSTLITDLDPAVERAVLRCLEPDPRDRPFSAMAVSAALPGGDALAAALAAGETPSPELVAASGTVGGLRPLWGWICLAGILAAVTGVAIFNSTHSLLEAPLPKPPAVLANRATEILHTLGYESTPADAAQGFDDNSDLLDYVERTLKTKDRWRAIESGELPAVCYWYRRSPEDLVPESLTGVVDREDPRLNVPGMALVVLDPEGRLIEYRAVPSEQSPAADSAQAAAAIGLASGPARAPDWQSLFTAAGLDVAALAPAVPRWTPPMFADLVSAWTLQHPAIPDVPFDVEAAAWNGKPVYFAVNGPWRQPAHGPVGDDPARKRQARSVEAILVTAMLLGAIVIALRNVRLNRGDRRTAFRLGAYIFLVNMVGWLFTASHVPDVSRELGLVMAALGPALFYAGSTYLTYLALEPYVRRHSPQRIISWTRLCAGKFDDPLVGRDVLIGMAAGGLLLAIILWGNVVPEWLGDPPVGPRTITLQPLMGPRWAISGLFDGQSAALFNGLFFVFMPLLFQVVFRKSVLAQAAFFLLLLGLFTFRESHPEVAWIANTIQLVVIFLLFNRGGLLAVTAAFYVLLTLQAAPLTGDFSAWYASSSIVVLVALFGIALFAFRSALGGRAAFSGLLRE